MIGAIAGKRIAVLEQALVVWKTQRRRYIPAGKPLAIVPASCNESSVTIGDARTHVYLFRIGGIGLGHTPQIHLERG